MTRPLSSFTFSCALLLLLCADRATAQQRSWTVDDVLALKSPGDVAISPDGRWVAFTVTQRGLESNRSLSDVWLAGADGGEALQLTRGARDARAPAWSPDGSWLAFLSERDSVTQVHGIRPTGGEAWPVTAHGESVNAFAISPDGRRLAFTSRGTESDADREREKRYGQPVVWDSVRSRDLTQLYVASLEAGDTSDAVRVSPEAVSVTGFVWAPDARRMAWSIVGPADESTFPSRDRPTGLSREAQVFVFDGAGSTPRQVTRMAGGASPAAWVDGVGLIVSATGQTLGTYNRHLWLVAADGSGEPVSLTGDLDEHARYVGAAPDALLVQAQRGTGSGLLRIPLRDGAPAGPPEPVTDERFYYSDFSATPNLARIAFLAESPSTPPDVHIADARRAAPVKRTELNPEAGAFAYGEQRVVRWTSAQDGEEIEGVLTLPVGYRDGDRVPLLLVIHGGPAGVSGNTYMPGGRYPIQVFASLGYASLQPNSRGSTGYGERFRGLNRGHISGHDWVDVESGVDHLIDAGIADPDRLGIMGWSFGGHHTFWGITRTDRFKAASAGAGANDLISMYSQTDLPGFYHTYLGPKPWEDFDLYEQRSAYRAVERVTTPLLIQVGERDERVPAEQSIQFYEAMSALGQAPVELVIYPGEGHGIREIGHTRDLMERNVAWFTRWIPVREAVSESSR